MTGPRDALHVQGRPRVSAERALEALRDLYGRTGTLSELPSERDRNFRVVFEDGELAVLKFSHPAEQRELLELQHRMQARVSARAPVYRFPTVMQTEEGGAIGTTPVGEDLLLTRLLAWVPGMPLARAAPRSRALLEGVGFLLGSVDGALEGLEDPAAHRYLRWDLRQAEQVVAAHVEHVGDDERRGLVDRLARSASESLGRHADALRTAVIHNDANDHNVLVETVAGDPDAAESRAVTGLIDFGDVVHSWLVAEVAIACAYAMLGASDPHRAAAAVVRGYHRAHPLTEPELAALPHLALLRLLVSVSLSASQAARDPENRYLAISETSAWRVIHYLADESPQLFHAKLREACDFEPCPSSPALVAWLRAHSGQAAPVLHPDPSAVPSTVLDLSVGSLELGSDAQCLRPAELSERLFTHMSQAGAQVGLGRYDEARTWYHGSAYEREGDGSERRTVHLGVDLFAPPGTPVTAPFAGWVHSVQDNAGELDYGPTLILEHRPADGVVFHTLYGHLGPEVLDRLSPGQEIAAGGQVGTVGAMPGNGNWPPHLHFQVIADLLGNSGTYPGVAAPGDRATWLSLSPDPNLVLGIPHLAPADRGLEAAELLQARRELLGPTLSVSYRRPLKIVRGIGQFLVDDTGRRYLDCVNNGPQHEHPVSARRARRVCAPPQRDASGPTERVLLRLFGQRGERARPAHGTDAHRSPRRPGRGGGLPRQHQFTGGSQPLQVRRPGRAWGGDAPPRSSRSPCSAAVDRSSFLPGTFAKRRRPFGVGEASTSRTRCRSGSAASARTSGPSRPRESCRTS
jgi:Ser/Thr protein kinase RdoA (MazF antagonist)